MIQPPTQCANTVDGRRCDRAADVALDEDDHLASTFFCSGCAVCGCGERARVLLEGKLYCYDCEPEG